MTRRRGAAVLLLAVLALTFTPTAPASAGVPDIPGVSILPDCRTGAPIGSPSSGVASKIDPGPKAPTAGDPLTEGGPSLYDTYGYGGAVWFDLDPTCFDKVNPVDRNGTIGTLASIGLSALTWAVALVVAVLRLVFSPTTLASFDDLQVQAAAGFGRIFAWGFTITGCVAIVMLARHAHRARTANLVNGASTIAVIGLLGIAAITWPLAVAPQVDKVATGIVGEANAAMSSATGATSHPDQTIADRVGANLHRALIYETWANGMFGDASSDTAREFGPRLYAAMSLSRAEQAQLDRDPSLRDDLVDKHREQVDEVYSDLKDADPTAAEYLAGAHNNERLGFVLLGAFGFVCVALVAGLAGLMLLVSLTAVRFVIAAIPIFAVIAVLPSQQGKLKGLLDWTATAVVTATVTGVIAAAHTAAIGGFLSSSTRTSPLTTMMLMGAATAAVFGIIGAWTWKQHKDSKRRGAEREGRRKRAEQEDRNAPAGAHGAGSARPAEAGFFTSTTSGAARGAAGGAATTALLGLASGGAVTAGAVLAGAARGAAVGAVGAQGGTAALAAGAVSARTAMPSEPRANALPSARASAPGAPPAPGASARTPRALPSGAHAPEAPTVTEPVVDVFRPDRTGRPEPRLVEPTEDLVYPIFTVGSDR